MVFHPEYLKSALIAAQAGIPVTFFIVIFVLLLSIPLGFAIALIRTGRNRVLSKILIFYVAIARGTPAIVQISLFYVAIPKVIGKYLTSIGSDFDIYNIPSIIYALIVFSFIMTAVLSEVFRGGLMAVNKGQLEAAEANGLTRFQGYYRIVIPQVFTYTLPVMCTNITGMVKLSTLVYAMSVADITSIAQVEGFKHGAYLEAYIVIAIMYVMINLSIELIFKLLEKRVAVFHKL